MVVRGLHGLQLYANRYWYQHLLAYLHSGMGIPQDLLTQLHTLLNFWKQDRHITFSQASVETSELQVLDHLPGIKSMVSELIFSRAIKETSEMSPEGQYLTCHHLHPYAKQKQIYL
jgi:hypothetical protein